MRAVVRGFLKLFGIIIPIFLGISAIGITLGNDLLSGLTPGLTSFAILNFVSYLFFFMTPIEAVFTGYLFLGYSPILLFLLTLPFALLAQTIDYFIGYQLSNKILGKYEKKEYFIKNSSKMRKYISKYGGIAILIFNVFPLSSPLMLFSAGIVKYRFKRAIFISAIGLTIKYLAIIFLYYRIVIL